MTDSLAPPEALVKAVEPNFGNITKNKYDECVRLGERQIVAYMRGLGACNPAGRYRFGVQRLNVESLLYYSDDVNSYFDTLDSVIPLHMFMHDGEIVLSTMTRESLGLYLADCVALNVDEAASHSPYTFWGVVLGRDVEDIYTEGRSLHKCMIMFNHLTRKIYYFDPNATWSYLTGEEQISQYVDYALSQYFEGVCDYEYVWSSAWRPPDTVQRIPNKREWDRGNCQTLCVILVDLITRSGYIDASEAYRDLLSMTSRDEFVYNYTCMLYEKTAMLAA